MVKPGAVRIKTSGYVPSGVTYLAFRNPDGSTALLFVNEGGSAQQLVLKDGTHTLTTAIPAKSIESIIWE